MTFEFLDTEKNELNKVIDRVKFFKLISKEHDLKINLEYTPSLDENYSNRFKVNLDGSNIHFECFGTIHGVYEELSKFINEWIETNCPKEIIIGSEKYYLQKVKNDQYNCSSFIK